MKPYEEQMLLSTVSRIANGVAAAERLANKKVEPSPSLASALNSDRIDKRTLAQRIKATDAFARAAQPGAIGRGAPEELLSREEFADVLRTRATVDNTSGAPVPMQFKDTRDKPARGGRVVSLLRVLPQDEPEIAISEEGAVTEVAAPTDYGTVSPETSIALTKTVVPDSRFPINARVTRGALTDSVALANFLEMILHRDLFRSVDNEVLNGDGSGSGQGKRFTGLANSSLPTQAVSTNTRGDTLITAAEKVRSADWQGPLAVVLNPIDARKLAEEKDAQGLPTFEPVLAALQFLGVESFTFSTVQAAGTGYVGSFAEGATLYVRQAPTIAITDSDGSDFVLGKAVVGLEARLALRVSFPSAFVQVTGL